MKLTTLRSLYIDQLKDLFNAEQQLVVALPRMASAASSGELKKAFQSHLDETHHHVDRLRKVLADLDESPTGEKCEAMEGLIEEGSELLRHRTGASGPVLDAGLIGAAQKVEHYEIAGYGTARTFAKLLGENEAANLLQETLDEEGQADKTLTAVAEKINVEATEEGEAMTDEDESDEAEGEEEEEEEEGDEADELEDLEDDAAEEPKGSAEKASGPRSGMTQKAPPPAKGGGASTKRK